MRYIEPLVGFVVFFLFMIGCLAAPKERRGWQWKAEALLGLSGMALFGLRLYGRYSHSKNAFTLFEGLLAGISIGIFVTLLLEGSMNPLGSRTRRPGEDGVGPT
jgi:hypothetical protein